MTKKEKAYLASVEKALLDAQTMIANYVKAFEEAQSEIDRLKADLSDTATDLWWTQDELYYTQSRLDCVLNSKE